MRLKFIKEPYLRKLKSLTKEEWIQKYEEAGRQPWLSNFFGHNYWHGDTGIEISEDIILLAQDAFPESDANSAERLYELLKDKITPAQATDPRLWCYMSHESCWDYMTRRWEITGNTDISGRYLISGSGRRSFTRNGISRLWWFAHLTYDEGRSDRYELTKVLLKNQNIQHHLLERNFGMNKNVLRAILDMSKDKANIFMAGNIQRKMDKLAKLINRWGGVRLLDYLQRDEIIDYVMEKSNIFND